MTEELSPKTFDLIGVLSGRDYPTLDVKVYFNETLGFEIHQLVKEIESAEKRGDKDALARLDEEKNTRVKQSEKEAYTITLKSIPESVRRSIVTKIEAEFTPETDFLGNVKPNREADEAFAKAFWKAYIRTITAPDGSVKEADEADINALYANAPSIAQGEISKGIQELQIGAKSGFEYAAKEIDFL